MKLPLLLSLVLCCCLHFGGTKRETIAAPNEITSIIYSAETGITLGIKNQRGLRYIQYKKNSSAPKISESIFRYIQHKHPSSCTDKRPQRDCAIFYTKTRDFVLRKDQNIKS